MASSNVYLKMRDFIIDAAERIIPISAVSPEFNGHGESKRADEISKILEEIGFSDYTRYDVKDADDILRSNLVLKVGDRERTLWLISYMDTIPERDTIPWKYPLFRATIEDNRIYGRGASDNGCSIFLSLSLLRELNADLLKYNLGIAIVADAETGGRYGIEELLERGVFSKEDLIIVLDYGSENGLNIDVAEKSILWMKFTVKGKQGHAKDPRDLVNSNREGMKFMLSLDQRLHSKFDYTDEIYYPPVSTFEPTKHGCSGVNINTIPGIDEQYIDARVLPEYDLDSVMDEIKATIMEFERESDATVEYEVLRENQAPTGTDQNSEVVRTLRESITAIKGNEARLIGVGRITSATPIRRKGYDVVSWRTSPAEVYHSTNEYCRIDDIIDDTEVIRRILYK